MSKFKIFYSWQSDLPGNKTRDFIRDCIDDAITFAGESDTIESIRDEATKDTTGSPNIVTTLFSKIDECDLFVADVTLCFTGDVTKEGKMKRSPNPNVLLELGYAVKTLGWERVICLSNADYGYDYPFDIAQNRRTSFNLEGQEKKIIQREIAKIIFSNIQMLKGQVPRSPVGYASHIIGSYDFEQKKVTSILVPLKFENSLRYKLQNEVLIDNAKELLHEIQAITERMESTKAINEELKEAILPASISNHPIMNQLTIQKPAIHALVESFKIPEVPVIWNNIEADKELINRCLNTDVSDTFFDLGDLRKVTQFINLNGSTYNGTEDEMNKFNKLSELIYVLTQYEIRIGYLNSFEGMKFIPLAIQNVSTVADTNIRIVINVIQGEIIEPSDHLITEKYEGLQGYLCSDDDKIGIIPELFLPKEDGVIHIEEKGPDPSDFRPKIPIFTGTGFAKPEKTSEDYLSELKNYIASTEGVDYYEFEVQSLRPGECRWLSEGMLLKPAKGKIVVNYRIHSDHSTGNLTGSLEL